MRKITFLLLFLLTTAMTTFGGGYQVGLHSARNVGMGLIGTSLSYDASTLFYNPGGAVFIKDHISFTGGVSFLMARNTFQPEGSNSQYHLEHSINNPLYLSAAVKLKNLSVGLTVNTPYGNSLSWGNDWPGRFIIQDLSFHAFTIQPTVAYKIGMIGIGVGLVYSTGSVDLNKAIPVSGESPEGKLNIQGNAHNYGFNAGVMVHPVKGLSLGVDYRSKIEMKVKGGDATFTDVPSSLGTKFPDGKVDVMLPLPANLDFGASYDFLGKITVGVNFCYVFWNAYDSLVFTFDKPVNGKTVQSALSLYENKMIIRAGVQLKLIPFITLRFGGYYDPSPVKSDYLNPQTPSMDQTGLTAGFSISALHKVSIDGAFLYIMGKERTGTYLPEKFAGTYKNAVYCPTLGVTVSL